MNVNNYPQVSLLQALEIVADAYASPKKRPTLMLGPPGIGKTEGLAGLAGALGLQFVCLELGLTVPEEIGGVPVRDTATGALIRLPLGPIRAACERPSLLLVDEVTRADAARQGAAMTGVNERRWGDWSLHPGTVVVLAGNEPDSGGVHSLLDALLNRCCVIRVSTQAEEVREYLMRLGEEGSTLRALATDYAVTSESRPQMIQPRPPSGFAESGALWASPRAIVHGLERLAARQDRGGKFDDDLGHIQLAGCIGIEIAEVFFTILRLRNKVPTVAEIVANPARAQLPTDFESAISVSGLIVSAAAQNQSSAWVYTQRLPKDFAEVRALVVRRLIAEKRADRTKFDKPGREAFETLTAESIRHIRAVAR